jgi:L-alanine-DL-glutamate epimerase-like enolase superfamily enzyme
MKITAIETIRLADRPNLLLAQVHTDEGLTGLGETSRGPATVEAQLHELVAPYLLGKNPMEIQKHSRHLMSGYLGFAASSAEVRAASVVDIALWDIFGQATNQPVSVALGGATRDRIRAYNTCAGYNYNSLSVARRSLRADEAAPQVQGPYDDQIAFVHRADELAQSLLDEGFTAMKIWPFDPYAEDNGGAFLRTQDLDRALEPWRKIRKAVGDRIEVMAEFHSLWNLQQAKQIARALEPYRPFWSEDPIKMCDVDSLAEYARSTSIPVCASETLGGMYPFRDVLANQAADIVMLDVGWCGGLTEARKIAALAESYQRPVAPHDCNGPVVWVASIHLMAHIPNALVMEVVRAYYSTWYKDVLTELPLVRDGYIHPLTGPGLGTKLLPGLLDRPGVSVKRSNV